MQAYLENPEKRNTSVPSPSLASEQARWQKITEIIGAAWDLDSSLRETYVIDQCGGDESLRLEIENLLQEMVDSSTLLHSGAAAAAYLRAPDLLPGTLIDRYRVQEKIGEGGMGTVYRAFDERLNRVVALKAVRFRRLDPAWAESLLTEAQMASALNHPGIVTVYDVIVWNGTPVLVMELVTGAPLSRLSCERMPLSQVLSVATQVCMALAAAHRAGIVHGDLKPDNIILREDGLAKILDFGLAKKMAAGADMTEPAIAGTPLYMSPEQARGGSLTPASDIFSFGLVLYKALTGKHLFARDSPLQPAQRIVTHRRVAPSSTNPFVPPGLNAVILRMVAENPADRPSAEEVSRELRAQAPNSQTPLQRRGVWFAVLSAAVLFTAAIVAWIFFSTPSSSDLTDLKVQPLTSRWGWELCPALSPDGKTIAFASGEELSRPVKIYTKGIGTTDARLLPTSNGQGIIGSLVWSPDGTRIAVKRSKDRYSQPGAISWVSHEGGEEQKLVDLKNGNLSSSFDWSPDGTTLAYSDQAENPNQLAIYLLDLRTKQKRKLVSPPGGSWGDWDPKFSPDGTEIAFKRVTGFWADDIYIIKVAGGPLRRVTAGINGAQGHAWTADGKRMIVSCQHGSTIYSLWLFPISGRQGPQPLVQGTADAITPVTSSKTGLIAWVDNLGDENIYRISMKGGSPPEKFIASTYREMQGTYSSNSQIAFLSDRSGNREVWIARPDGSLQTQVTNSAGASVGHPQWSHDGRRLAYQVRSRAALAVFKLDCHSDEMTCGAATRLPSPGLAEFPSWSADDRFLYFASDLTGRFEIYKEPIQGGLIQQMTHDGGTTSCESRDGKWLYFYKPATQGVWRVSMADARVKASAQEESVIGSPYHLWPESWTVAGDEIVFLDSPLNQNPPVLQAYNVRTRKMRVIANGRTVPLQKIDTRLAVSGDLQWLLYSKYDESNTKIMLAQRSK